MKILVCQEAGKATEVVVDHRGRLLQDLRALLPQPDPGGQVERRESGGHRAHPLIRRYRSGRRGADRANSGGRRSRRIDVFHPGCRQARRVRLPLASWSIGIRPERLAGRPDQQGLRFRMLHRGWHLGRD